MDELSSAELAAGIALANELDKAAMDPDWFKGLESFCNGIAYEGFNPVMLRSYFCSLAKKAKRNMREDLKMILLAYAIRGANLMKILEGTTKEVKELAEITRVYGLQARIGRSGNDKKYGLTLHRIAACFPVQCCQVVKRITSVVPVISISVQFKDYPKCMMTPVFAALIPRNHKFTDALKQAHLLFSIRLNEKKQRKSPIEIIMKFQALAINSNLLTEEERMTALVALEVVDIHNKRHILKDIIYTVANYVTKEYRVGCYIAPPRSKLDVGRSMKRTRESSPSEEDDTMPDKDTSHRFSR